MIRGSIRPKSSILGEGSTHFKKVPSSKKSQVQKSPMSARGGGVGWGCQFHFGLCPKIPPTLLNW